MARRRQQRTTTVTGRARSPKLRRRIARPPRIDFTYGLERRPRPALISEDRRLYRPEVFRPRAAVLQPATPPRPQRTRLPLRLTFRQAPKVSICQRRSARRRVIFAMGAGGSRGIRKRTTNRYSHIKCEGKR